MLKEGAAWSLSGVPQQVEGLVLALPCTHQGICIQEDALAIMGECPTVKLGEGDSELRSLQKGQVDVVYTVYQVHLDDLIKHPREDHPGKDMPNPRRTAHHLT